MFYTNIGRTLDLDLIGQNIHGFEEGQTINLLGKKTQVFAICMTSGR